MERERAWGVERWIRGVGLCLVLAVATGVLATGVIHGRVPAQEDDGGAEPAGEEGTDAADALPEANDWSRTALTAKRVNNKTIRKEGGSGTDKPARMALGWLVRHQNENGSWSPVEFHKRCKKPDKPCKIRVPAYTNGKGFEGHDAGVTGLALLAFTGGGHTHLEAGRPEYARAVQEGTRWLLMQQEDGVIGRSAAESHVYNHAIATMALAELLIGSGDRQLLQEPVEHALQHCLRAQNKNYGWRYGIADGSNDTSVTGWMAQALHLGRACVEAELIDVGETDFDQRLEWVGNWLDRTTSKLTGGTGYQSPGDPGSIIRGVYPDPFPFLKDQSPCTGISLMLRRLSGASVDSEVVRAQVEVLAAHPPRWQPPTRMRKGTINLYYWYYASHGMFQVGGGDWKKWNKKLKSALRKNQHTNGCEEGSWDPIGEWGVAGGRVYSTALGAITLQVYQRYARAESIEEPDPDDGEKSDDR